MIALFVLALMSQTGTSIPTPPPDPEKKICRSMVMTGSIMPKRSCRTKAEWAKLQESTESAWETAQRKRGFVSRDPSLPD